MEAWKRAYVLDRVHGAMPLVAALVGIVAVFSIAARYGPWLQARSTRVLIQREIEPGVFLTAQTSGARERSGAELIEFRLRSRGGEAWIGWVYGRGSSPSGLAPTQAKIVAPCRLSIALPWDYVPKDPETRLKFGGEDWIVRFSMGRS